ncbi:hypothetical protein [Actinoplanes sp. NPDC051851]|uniref:hypothetical protein n=1 Tax=Actinoplanes sp. NPDC051851 TaxID=3154753 RepID=UPI00341699BB
MASHYPYLTRVLMSLFAEGALTTVDSIQVEPDYGYAAMIGYVDGSHRMIRGNDVGINPGASNDVVKDKAYTKHFLLLAGISTPPGEAFLLRWWAERLAFSRTTDQAAAYIRETTGYPVYVKPVDGSKGRNVWRVVDETELARVVSVFDQERVRVMLVEKAIDLPDYRLVILDGALVFAYRREPLTVTGDGVLTVKDLLSALLQERRSTGRDTSLQLHDPRIARRLDRLGLTWDAVLSVGERARLLDVANLSAGGTAVDVTTTVHERWRVLAARTAALFGLRLCGVDLVCADITGGEGEYAVLEVNGTPGLDHYATTGPDQEAAVRNLYRRLLL